MNRLTTIFSLLAIFFTFSLAAQPKIVFEKPNHDFGEIVEGAKATHTFTFTNEGTAPLVLTMVRASCGCTTPSWTKEPIKPGEKGTIVAEFNSQNSPGAFNKSISVWTNAGDQMTVLTIKGVVIREGANGTDLSQKLTIDQAIKKIGKVERAVWTPFEMKVQTADTAPVVINSISSDCNCIRMDPYTNPIITPGGAQSVKLQINARQNGALNTTVRLIGRNNQVLGTFQLQADVADAMINPAIGARSGN